MPLNWTIDRRSETLTGKVGHWVFFTIERQDVVAKTEIYLLKCRLPGMRNLLGTHPSVSFAKDKAHAVWKFWLEEEVRKAGS